MENPLEYRREKSVFPGFKYALKGIGYAFVTQKNMRIHAIFLCLAIIAGIFYSISITEWLVIIVVSTVVIMAELINTAIEVFCDFVSPAYQQKIGFIKDLAAGAVLVAAICAGISGIVIFLPKVLDSMA